LIFLVRKIQWKNGEWRKQRLIELSDQYHKIVWVRGNNDEASKKKLKFLLSCWICF